MGTGKVQTAQRHFRKLRDVEAEQTATVKATQVSVRASVKPLLGAPDFLGDPERVRLIAEVERLSYGHIASPTFATETSRIEPLPHQRIAVYEHMLTQPRLRFLLADDAGAGKTIMAGLYVREMQSRRLIRRVLIVPPAGLLGNWEREVTDNEWARACNLRSAYWLHVVFDCAPSPRLVRVQDPFAKLLVKSAGVIVNDRDILAVGETGWVQTSSQPPLPEVLRPLFWGMRHNAGGGSDDAR